MWKISMSHIKGVIFRKFPDLKKKNCQKFLVFRKFYPAQKKRKAHSFRKFQSISGNFDHTESHLWVTYFLSPLPFTNTSSRSPSCELGFKKKQQQDSKTPLTPTSLPYYIHSLWEFIPQEFWHHISRVIRRKNRLWVIFLDLIMFPRLKV